MLKRLGEILNRLLPLFALTGLLACTGVGSLAPGNNLSAPEKGSDAVGDIGGGDGSGGSGDLGGGSTEGGASLTVSAVAGNNGMTRLNIPAATGGGTYQPTSDGHAQSGTFRYVRVISASGSHDPQCGAMGGDATHNDFAEPYPQVTAWFGTSESGPWVHPDTWASDACGVRPIYCGYYDQDENGNPIAANVTFMKVQAVFDAPVVATFPPKPPQHFESCPFIISCEEFARMSTEVQLKLFEGVASCGPPPSLPSIFSPRRLNP
ncbi:MAG: hypothetical protein U1F66_00900 [bacterium]